MTDSTPLYNSRITKIYLDYIDKNYPEIDKNLILKSAKITKEELEDQAHWLTQDQVDRFQDAVVKHTGNPNVAREAGRFAIETPAATGVTRHYLLGLLNLTTLYLLISKVYSVFSKSVSIKGKQLGPNQIEIISTPLTGVKEKPYQCENRIGFFESVAKLFTSEFAHIEETSCFHKGDQFCRYIISWEKSPFLIWRRIQNYSLILSIILSIILFFVLSFQNWAFLTVLFSFITLSFAFISAHLEKKGLAKNIEEKGVLAQNLLEEMNIRHNNALLIQEIGQATASILEIDTLLAAVVESMKMHMDFDRGMIMICNEDKTRLFFKAGYGYDKEKEAFLQETEFNLTKPDSKGVFVLAFKKQKPFLVNDFSEIAQQLSPRSLAFAKVMGALSLICVPIIYENEPLGILTVDNVVTKRPLTKSDMSFIMGLASQIAISIVNALSFQKLQENEKKYRDLVENANSIIMRRNTLGQITFFNEFAQNFFRYSEKEAIGKTIENIIIENSHSAQNEFEKILDTLRKDPERLFISENETILKNEKKKWIAWTYKPIFSRNNELMEVLCIGNDITDLKQAEIEKKDLESRLQRAQKMEAIGTLAGGVAHDLNNILSGIVSYPELLLMDLPPGSRLWKPIKTIQKSGERAASIVQDLLTLARRGVVTKKVINLNSLFMDYIRSPEYESITTYNPGVIINYDLDDNLLNIEGSPVHLLKTIMNLVNNAVEAIPDTGYVKIITKNSYVDRAIAGYEEVKQGDYVTLEVSDNGTGISSKDLERIFEPFYTKKTMGKSGTGLGMAVVWGTIKDHSGFIDVKSIEGKGTTFKLYFPITRSTYSEIDETVPIENLKGKGEKILIIDDVEEQREIVLGMLVKLGYSVESVSSGEDAIEYIKTHSTDLLVLDMIMEGGIDGLETYKKILEINPNQKAIITSGFSETNRVKEAQRLGAGQYIKKPYLLEKIGGVIKKELNH